MTTHSISPAPTAAEAPLLSTVPLRGTDRAPRFEIDPSWPKPLPEGWITGQLPACASTTTTTSSDEPRRHHQGGRGDVHQGAGGAHLRSCGRSDRCVGRLGSAAAHGAQLRRRSRQQHLDHRQRRRHDPEVHARREASAADRHQRRVRHVRRHAQRAPAQCRAQRVHQARRHHGRSDQRRRLHRRRLRQPPRRRVRQERQLSAPMGHDRRRRKRSRRASAACSPKSCTA